MTTPIHAVWAADLDNIIAVNGKIPWLGTEYSDTSFFRRLTMGHPIIMGRKTFESLPKPLDGRLNIVFTRQPNKKKEYQEKYGQDVVVASDLACLQTYIRDAQAAFVIGGKELIGHFIIMNRVKFFHVTEVNLHCCQQFNTPEIHDVTLAPTLPPNTKLLKRTNGPQNKWISYMYLKSNGVEL